MKHRLVLALVALAAIPAVSASAALAAAPPLAMTGAAESVDDTAATLNGKVNPEGASVSTCRFEFGTSPAYGSAVPCSPAELGTGSVNVSVSALVEDLEPGVIYHYRVVAASANGATSGVDRTFTTTGSPSCTNAAERLEQGVRTIQLPACMGLEQVSPTQKYSQRAVGPVISADGDSVLFRSLAALAGTPGNFSTLYGDFYVSQRGSAGWAPSSTAPPPSITSGWGGGNNMARSFDPGLSRWAVLGGTVNGAQFNLGVGQMFLGSLDGSFDPISPVLAPIDGNAHGKFNVVNGQLQGASADHRTLYFNSGELSATYLPGDPTPSGGADRNVYVAALTPSDQPSLALLARDKDGKVWGANCGTRLGGIGSTGIGWRPQGAVAADGSSVYFSTRPAQATSVACDQFTNGLRILQRVEGIAGAEISELVSSECDRVSPACDTTNGDDLYQGASVDQTKVYFTTSRQLADSDLDGVGGGGCAGFVLGGCDLYLYDAEKPSGERLTQVSAGEVTSSHPVPGEEANVLNGTVAIAGDGSRVYFVATGAISDDLNPEGKAATDYPGTDPKLYVWDLDSEELRFVGALSPSDVNVWGADGTLFNRAYTVPVTGVDGVGKEVGGDGHTLVVQSKADLTANDADGGQVDSFRYDVASDPPTLLCVSCKPGGPDSEPFNVAARFPESPEVAGTAFAEQNRWVSENGNSILIRTREQLLATDLNEVEDDYLWTDGRLSLLPGTSQPPGPPPLGDTPPVLSHDGSEVAFTSYVPLLPSDGDTAPDVYVARANGGFPTPIVIPECVGETCQGQATEPLLGPSVPSETNVSKGNVRPRDRGQETVKKCPKGKRKVVRQGKVRCIKRASKKRGAKQRANYDRGGQK